jgi:hypothetical protein
MKSSPTLILAIAATLCVGTPTGAVDYPDILSSWCSTTSKYTFTRKRFAIFIFGSRGEGSFKIVGYRFKPTEVDVGWYNPQVGERHVVFGEFSQDGKTMFQLPDGDAPRKEFKRC